MKKSPPYHVGRLGKDLQLTYRLKRRTTEVINILQKYPSLNKIIDLGAADGLMLSMIKSRFDNKQCFGIDISYELLETNRDANIKLLQANALNIPFKDKSFDVIIATAIIEHLSRPFDLLRENYRLLRNGGLIIITTPDPFWIHVAETTRLFQNEEHKSLIKLNFLKGALVNSGFRIIKAEKFMISPVGLPFELSLERLIKKSKLDFLLLNQIAVGQK